MSDLVFAAAFFAAFIVLFTVGYALAWYVVGVIYNYSPRFRRWYRRNCK